ncbi:MAG: hypothetical protein KH897_19190 [Bacteroides sp.]|uniref:DUF6850 family outer membrane beta-barrel protein n=1 Tax=Bacteroides sp. TaxID=29523 RepID=UPI0025BFA478|nr:DUF6850 family outer membrane beta-barrel protein [Bacteroides sp.]MBS6240434.1 hypothetical protein [Bacteroides sp.]
MKQRFLILSAIISLLPIKLMAADTLTVEQKIVSEYNHKAVFRNQIWQNIAIRYDLRPFSLTTVSVNGLYEERGNAALAQEGNGEKNFSAEVNSSIVLNQRNRLFGTASYRNGRRENVIWNENSDYSLIYPYVVGDSIGGYMKEEEYKFSGGYTHRFGQWTAGAELAYRAVIAYRDKDPRPQNIISDLQAHLALSRNLSGKYILGLSVQARQYNQKSDIKFLADKGSTSVYQMLGLGMDYVRFASSQTSSRYTGSGIDGSIDLLPISKHGECNGFSASLRTDYFHLTKELVSINYAPINEIKNVDISLEGAWTRRNREWEYGVRLLALLQQRTGVENIFGDPTGNVYPKISSVDQFKNSTFQATLKGMIGQLLNEKRHWGWTLLPIVSYGQTKTEYKDNGRYIETASASGGLEAQSLWKVSKVLLSASIAGGYTSNVKSEYSLTGLDSKGSVGSTLLSNIDYLSDDHASVALKLRGDYILSDRYAVFLSANWLHQEYNKCGGTDRIEVSLGVTF